MQGFLTFIKSRSIMVQRTLCFTLGAMRVCKVIEYELGDEMVVLMPFFWQSSLGGHVGAQ